MVGNSRPVGGIDETMGAASGWRTTKNHLRRAPVQKDVGSSIPNHHPRRAPLQIDAGSGTFKRHPHRGPLQIDVGSGTPKHHPHRGPLQIETRSCRLQIDGKAEDKADGNGRRTLGSRARGSTGGNVAKEKDKQKVLPSDAETEDENVVDLLQKVSPSDAETEYESVVDLLQKLRKKITLIWNIVWLCFSVVCMGYIAVYRS
ncbi:hypothetical protein GQ55_3G252100 [Panicum hallii var. hallii]|uniref:Uncharacterized protein n=1 Tax=Panicum hallii var. hallii TaxID=1504633 RepID=A0A2T7ED77_9POAL|nr:hypothetical protein GQ55_3G252100 [Panicum hallii var. hallii]